MDGVHRVVQDKGQQDQQILLEREAGTIRCPLPPYRRPLESEDDGVHRQPQEEHNRTLDRGGDLRWCQGRRSNNSQGLLANSSQGLLVNSQGSLANSSQGSVANSSLGSLVNNSLGSLVNSSQGSSDQWELRGGRYRGAVSYTHLTLPTTPYV